TAPEEFYVTALRRRGLDVSLVRSSYAGRPGETVLRCGSPARETGEILLQNKKCVAVRVSRSEFAFR
ncbi:MAG TPA: hypothetical protein VFX95_01485, partial [Caulobacteraceae bacterium]|nr:hypothetical protein [Caulobacteraceae bacterium]